MYRVLHLIVIIKGTFFHQVITVKNGTLHSVDIIFKTKEKLT